MTGPPSTAALQGTLAAEHSAVHLYGVFGGRVRPEVAPELYAALRQGYDVHRAQRDHLVRTLRDQGVEPVAAAVAYDPPGDLASEIGVQQSALRLERGCAASYAFLVAQTVDAQRRWAITTLVSSAVRQLSLGGEPEPFPGLGE